MKLSISIDDQMLELHSGDEPVRSFPISSAAKGVGTQCGSYRTPVGRFRIAEKIGAGEPTGTIFKNRVAVGLWTADAAPTHDLITSRILRLDGLEPANANTFDRCIYIHGTNHEDRIGEPCSHGCIRMRNADVVELFDLVAVGAEVVIQPPQKNGGKIIFMDCDSTLSRIEGIDELARFGGADMLAEVEELTRAAMNGSVPLHEVFPRRMAMIRPNQQACDAVAQMYLDTIVPGVERTIQTLKDRGWMIVILSGGFANLIRPLADVLGIDHLEAVPLELDAAGDYLGYGSDYPTTRNGGKPAVISEWKQALRPTATVMVGDGMSDAETMPEVDLFIGFGGVVARDKVKQAAPVFVTDFADILAHVDGLPQVMGGE